MQTAVVKQSRPSVESLQKKKQNVPDAQRAKKPPIWRVLILILHQSMDNCYFQVFNTRGLSARPGQRVM